DFNFTFSISMTTCSTMAALGMMPLCLYLYTLSWNLEQNLTIPYQNIGITLVCLIIPVAFGIYVNYRWPKQSKIILKIGAIAGGLLFLVVTGAGMVLMKEFWSSDIILLMISFIFPLIGHATGFLLALLTHQSWQRCRTISLETGTQNVQMCFTMLQLSFTAEQLVQIFGFVLAYGLFQMLNGFFMVAAYKMYKRRLKNKHGNEKPSCQEARHRKKSTSPKETTAFLEVNEEATLSPGPSGPVDPHGAPTPTGDIARAK
uniref:Solute carrier family 10 member 6 n=1 Tax=Bos taurus TaxID=9913 RepID=G8JKY3_BOVIN